jgi:hypothetical protein
MFIPYGKSAYLYLVFYCYLCPTGKRCFIKYIFSKKRHFHKIGG